MQALISLFNVVFARLLKDSPAWVVRFVFAVSERWHWASGYSPLPEEVGVVRSPAPAVRVAARFEDAIRGKSSQSAHWAAVIGLMDARSACEAHSLYAACSTCANWVARRTVSPNGSRPVGSHSSGY